jgi:hypothetical protein
MPVAGAPGAPPGRDGFGDEGPLGLAGTVFAAGALFPRRAARIVSYGPACVRGALAAPVGAAAGPVPASGLFAPLGDVAPAAATFVPGSAAGK